MEPNHNTDKYLARIAEATEKTARWVAFWSILSLIGAGLTLLVVFMQMM